MEIPHEAQKLDEILAKCRWRFSNHYPAGHWEDFAKQIAGSDSKNPLFEAYINELVEEKYIRIASEGDGYIATAKGLMFKGYAQTIIDAKETKTSQIRKNRISHLITILAVVVGSLLTYLLTPAPKGSTDIKIQLLRDTIRIHDTMRIHDTIPKQ